MLSTFDISWLIMSCLNHRNSFKLSRMRFFLAILTGTLLVKQQSVQGRSHLPINPAESTSTSPEVPIIEYDDYSSESTTVSNEDEPEKLQNDTDNGNGIDDKGPDIARPRCSLWLILIKFCSWTNRVTITEGSGENDSTYDLTTANTEINEDEQTDSPSTGYESGSDSSSSVAVGGIGNTFNIHRNSAYSKTTPIPMILSTDDVGTRPAQ
ncbi:hypothetical protein KIN20_002527 [Parelaphostrongylus tenuis]|uniref:Uncharacterized protein n=1 Tax=Parelaphostrongylus tenuis TaxID=148309 RepID=A0AAD5MEC4_PARTN|nr:hypothetical protein KIN20_002527 [Parelaphostrongylus tenuis]